MSGSGDRLSYDVVVVGARCAGAATAMLLARRGLRVLVVDRGRYATDTLSTHALMRAGVLLLHRWGLLGAVRAAGTPGVQTTSFHYGAEVLEIGIKARDGVDGLRAPRRFVIDRLLVDAARDAGAEVRYETQLVDLLRSPGGRVSGVVLTDADGARLECGARLVVGADGARSTVADLVGARLDREGRHSTGVLFTYWSGLELDGYHWYYGPGVSAGLIPTNDGLTCVFAAVPSRRFQSTFRDEPLAGYRQVLAECEPELARRVERGERAERLRGFPGRAGFLRQSWGPGWALVGDAGYFKDPITAHGITDALIAAELLARAGTEGTDEALAGYQETRDGLAMGLFEVTDSIASFEWDLPAVKQLHLTLSDEMKRETRFVTSELPEQPFSTAPR